MNVTVAVLRHETVRGIPVRVFAAAVNSSVDDFRLTVVCRAASLTSVEKLALLAPLAEEPLLLVPGKLWRATMLKYAITRKCTDCPASAGWLRLLELTPSGRRG